MNEQDDNILVQYVNDGDFEAFRGIVKKHQRNIFYFGLKFFRNQEDAEDFAQEVFLKAFEKLRSFKGKVPFKSWLYKIAFNLAVNRYHVRKRRDLFLQDFDDLHAGEPAREDKNYSVEEYIIKKEQKNEIQEILKGLPVVYNLVIKMYYFDGLKLKEIKDVLDMPLNTVKSYIHRAKMQIKKVLLENRGGSCNSY